ncbi:MAG TPA: 30S ribosomal protein S4 [Candidatus Saccharimonadales bacterium]|nr:30S ribosomal protein S4 [Candidatus Saccharimonadales bacterium]
MARYRGSKHKLARREGVNVIDKDSQSLIRRLNIPPGVHGRKRKRKLSEFGIQLREKQKAKAVYGLLDKQFSKMVKNVQNKKGETGEMLVALLETRLDNVVYRLGFAKSRTMARQFVSHGHVTVNNKKLNIPSYQVRIDDVIAISPKIQKNPDVVKKLEEKDAVILPFLDRKGLLGKLVRMPKSGDVQVPFSTQLIIEYYSR